MITQAKFAVAIIALRHNTETERGGWECILVARKDDHTRCGLPGGKVNPPKGGAHDPEASISAAVREFLEETGIHSPVFRMIPHGTVLDSSGYFTTFYLLDTTGMELPDNFTVAAHEAPVRWGSIYELLDGPYGPENAERLRKIGLL